MSSNTVFDFGGGRKFVMAIAAMVVAGILDAKSPNGLSTTMAGVITALYTAFAASNSFVSSRALSKQIEEEGQQVAQAPEEKEQAPAPKSQPMPEAPKPPDITQALVPILNQVGTELVSIRANQEQVSKDLAVLQKAMITLVQNSHRE